MKSEVRLICRWRAYSDSFESSSSRRSCSPTPSRARRAAGDDTIPSTCATRSAATAPCMFPARSRCTRVRVAVGPAFRGGGVSTRQRQKAGSSSWLRRTSGATAPCLCQRPSPRGPVARARCFLETAPARISVLSAPPHKHSTLALLPSSEKQYCKPLSR
jgi:hypothetical protein